MMKRIKRTVSLLLMAVIAFSAFQTAFAGNEPDIADTYEAVSEEVTVAELETQEDDETVAEIWVCSNMSIPLLIGHTYVYILNLSQEPIKVGAYEVPVGEGVSVGCFAFSAYDGWGIYYNLEAYRENRDSKEDRIWSKSKKLNADELEKASDYILSYLNHWDPIFNCSFFSYSVWNAATGELLIPSPLPIIAHLMLMITGGKRGELDMEFAAPDSVYHQKGMGSSAELVHVSSATLNK